MTVLAGYLAVVLFAGAVFFYLGLPWSTLCGAGGRDPFGERTVLAGLAVLAVWSWQWVDLTGLSLAPGLRLLAVLNVPAFVWAARRRWRGPMPLGRYVLGVLSVVMPCLAVFAFYYRNALGGSRPYAVSLGNNDLPNYAIMAQHLLHHGLQAHGAFAGVSFGHVIRTDVVGAFAAIAVVAFFAHLDISVVIMPLLLLGVVLTVSALTRLIVCISQLSRYAALGVALTACSSSIYFYSVAEGFFAQLYGMALFLSALAVVVERLRDSPDDGVAWSRSGVGELGLLLAGLISFYPHMVFLGLPVLLAVVGCAALLGSERLTRQLWSAGGLVALGCAVVVVVDGSWAYEGAKRTFALGSLAAGWGLSLARPGQIAGFQQYPLERPFAPIAAGHGRLPSPTTLGLLVLAVVVAALTLLLLRRLLLKTSAQVRRSTSWALSCLVVPLGSYYAFYTLVGKGYEQWKWLVFFQPLMVASALALLAALCARALSPSGSGVKLASLVMAPVCLAFALTLVAARPFVWPQATNTLRAVQGNAVLAKAPGVNVEARTRARLWDAMWVGYYLSRSSVVFTSRTYFPTLSPDPRFPTVQVLPGEHLVVVPAAFP